MDFNPRTPCGVRPVSWTEEYIGKDFNPRTPCGVRRDVSYEVDRSGISIHAPLAGCDSMSPRAAASPSPSFQSTHPLRGATRHVRGLHAHRSDFNPRTPCGVRPKEGCNMPSRILFQSTHPLRGATSCNCGRGSAISISIHAPLAGCDAGFAPDWHRDRDFNPRTPCGVRHLESDQAQTDYQFQSTHPLRGATRPPGQGWGGQTDFNPRTPCGVRRANTLITWQNRYFNPRTPCGVRPLYADFMAMSMDISIHAPLAGCDTQFGFDGEKIEISIHAPLAGCDPSNPRIIARRINFNPRTPCGVRRAGCAYRPAD